MNNKDLCNTNEQQRPHQWTLRSLANVNMEESALIEKNAHAKVHGQKAFAQWRGCRLERRRVSPCALHKTDEPFSAQPRVADGAGQPN